MDCWGLTCVPGFRLGWAMVRSQLSGGAQNKSSGGLLQFLYHPNASVSQANLKMQKELEALRKMSGSATPSPKPRPSPNTRTSTEKEPSGTKARNSRMCQKKDSKELTEEENEESQEEEEDEEEEEQETEENSQAGEQAEAEEDAEEGDDEEAEERTPEVTGKKPTGRKQPKTNSAPQSLGAKKNRLRRMCELKPSGRLNVPEPIHEAWKNGSTAEREDMIATLDECGWRKDPWEYVCHVHMHEHDTLSK